MASPKRLKVARGELPNRMFWKIGEVSKWLGVSPYVLRYWEAEFGQWIRPERSRLRSNEKLRQRIYNRHQAVMLGVIKHLLHVELYTVAGAKRQLLMAETPSKTVKVDGEPEQEKAAG